jgi:hypothetical protein
MSFTLDRRRHRKKVERAARAGLKMNLRMENYSQVTANFTISQPVASLYFVRAYG